MKPVFREEMDFLGIDKGLEGYLWIDSRCYYGFDENCNKITFGRALEKLPKTPDGLITHASYCKYHYESKTKDKVDLEKSKFKQYIEENEYDEIIISVSGGKDSTVMADMVMDIAKNGHKILVLSCERASNPL